MATSTFSGPLRSESTFKVVSKDQATGTITEVSTLGDLPVSLADANVTLTNADHSGRVLLVPDGAAQVTVMALDATNWQISGRVVAAATPAFADQ